MEYDSISRVLSNVIEANVYIVSKTGKIYGYAFLDDFECDTMIDKIVSQGEFPKHYVNWLLKMDTTSPNIKQNDHCVFGGEKTAAKQTIKSLQSYLFTG